MKVKIEGMGNEEYIRNTNCCPCKNNNETCNFCEFYPKDMDKHKHKFFLKSNVLITSFWKKLLRREYRKIIYICQCRKIKSFDTAITVTNTPRILK